jgi:ArsR family transcriptional regulator
MKASSAIALEVRPLSRLFKALGDETRVRIVALLTHGELCVCHLQDALAISQPNASRQLGILYNAGVVERRRAGNWVYFKLAEGPDETCKQQLKALCRSFAGVETLRHDVARLLETRGPDSCT